MAVLVQPVVLVIADISGYTRFMLGNAAALPHAQAVITSLLDAVLAEADLPLVVNKLEGDAVLLFARRSEGAAWQRDRQRIESSLPRFYAAFERRLQLLRATNTCGCGACKHLDRLAMKFIVHAGQAVLHRQGRFDELAGPDLILVHRLLKNSIAAPTYLLVTDAALEVLRLAPAPLHLVPHREDYDDVGPVQLWVDTELASRPLPGPQRHPAGVGSRCTATALKMWAMVRARRRHFARLPTFPALAAPAEGGDAAAEQRTGLPLP